MAVVTRKQDPLDKRKFTIDFATWLGGSTIDSAAWVVPTGLTAASESVTSTTAINYLSATNQALDNKEYAVAVTITTNDAVPRKKTQRFIVGVESGL